MNNMIYTPKERIPIGQAIETETGVAIRIKKANSGITETISIEEFIRLIILSTDFKSRPLQNIPN